MGEELIRLWNKFEEYLNLNYVKSRNDSDEEPFKTKYEARDLLKAELDKLEPQLANLSELDQNVPTKIQLNEDELNTLNQTYKIYIEKINLTCNLKYSMSAKSFLVQKLFEFNLGKNYIETEEIEMGERLISKIVRELDGLESAHDLAPSNEDNNLYNPLVFNLKLSCFLESVFVWSHRSEYEKCAKILKSIDEIYSIYQGSLKSGGGEGNVPFDPIEMLGISKGLSVNDRRTNFEALYTHSMFYSAQVYGKMDDKEKSAHYCQLTLQRQIDEHNEKSSPSQQQQPEETSINETRFFSQQPQEQVTFNSLDWATHAGALSQYYVSKNDFATARHCLCCADCILDQLNETDSSERLKEHTQSIKRCWAKYAIELLKTARSKLLESTEHDDNKTLLAELDQPSKFHFNLPKNIYPNLERIEKAAITSNMPLDYEQAKRIFLAAQTILNQAREFFQLDGYVTDHFEIARDLSELYQRLIFFEDDLERRCKMHKRRLDLLIPVCDEISEQFYLSVKRQLLFDLGSIYSDLMDCKIDIFREKKEANLLSQSESVSAVAKINQLAMSGISRFDAFLNTMKVQPKREVLPDKFDDHNVRSALLAKFYIGRLYSKLVAVEPAKRLINMKHTMDNYSYLVDYCERNATNHPSEIVDNMKIEYDVCKEMIIFLPAQMEKIRSLIH